MKNKKGFTLIELLAVIVILAVIALIATPIILNLINDAKESSFKDSVSIAIRSSDLYTEINDIDLISGVSITDLNLSHSDIKYGTIILNNNKLTAVNVSNGKYCANGTLGNIGLVDGECDTTIPEMPSIPPIEEYSEIVTYTVNQNGEILSGIDFYEYYLSDEIVSLDENTIATGVSNSKEVVIDIDTNYVYFRIISAASQKGIWTSEIINYVDKHDPIISDKEVIDAEATYTISDKQLDGYQITDTNVIPSTDWIDISGTTFDGTYTAPSAGTYYIWVKDKVGHTNSSEIAFSEDAFCLYNPDDIVQTFSYEAASQEFIVPCNGTYKLEVYGAEGGAGKYYTTTIGGAPGKGGYTVGNVELNKSTSLYVYVSNKPSVYGSTQNTFGFVSSFNGGGAASFYDFAVASPGGGATHIATADGLLSSLESNKSSILIVAGGGGGASYKSVWGFNFNGGNGGGLTGSDGTVRSDWSNYYGRGGTQTAGGRGGYDNAVFNGSFGQGGSLDMTAVPSSSTICGAGGGGYYGGGAGQFGGSGGGGAGYVSSNLIAGTTTMTSGVNSGDGEAIITYLG